MAIRKATTDSLLSLQSNEELYDTTEQLRLDLDETNQKLDGFLNRYSATKDDLAIMKSEMNTLRGSLARDMKKLMDRIESIRRFGR